MTKSRWWSIQVKLSGGKPARVSFCVQEAVGWRCEQISKKEVDELINALQEAADFIDVHA